MPKEEKKSLLTKIVERRPPLYWWILLNISIACLAVVSWLYFVPTFNFPEVPKHYERMIWLGRPPQLPAYGAEDAPKGITIDTEAAHQIFTSEELTSDDLTELNATFLRNYIQGIKLEKFNYYIKGDFQVTRCRALNTDDMFQHGIVVEAQAIRKIGGSLDAVPFLVNVEYILPGVDHGYIDHFTAGTSFQLHRVPNFCSVIHVERSEDESGETIVHLTLAPLVTIPPLHFSSSLTLNLDTPERIYPEKQLPLFN